MLLKGEFEGSELFVPSQKCESVGDAVVGGSSDSELSKQSFVLIIYTKCCYHPKWSPVLMIVLLVKSYVYLCKH